MIYLVFLFGVFAGSFLNVVIYRLKSGESIGLSRSFCPECRTQLKWYDLAPILSFLWFRGRCRYCREKISWQYPLVELLSGLIWIGVFYKVFNGLGFEIWDLFRISDFGFRILNAIYYILIFSVLLVIAVYDFKWRIIPDKIVYPAIAAALIFNVYQTIQPPLVPPFDKGGLGGVLLTAFIAFLFFFLIFYFSSGRAMGLGDAKLAFLIGLFLSPLLAIAAFMSAFIIGAAFGIILLGISKIPHPLVYKGWGIKSQIAFGPFLVLGAFVVFFLSSFFVKLFSF